MPMVRAPSMTSSSLSLAKTPSAGQWLIFQFGSAHNLVT
jgi:hypothetical protein